MDLKWRNTLMCMKLSHPCSVCEIECKYLYDEYWRCPNCMRIYGFIDESIMEGIIKETDKKKAGRPKGSVNKKRLIRMGLLGENKDEKKD